MTNYNFYLSRKTLDIAKHKKITLKSPTSKYDRLFILYILSYNQDKLKYKNIHEAILLMSLNNN